IPLAALPLHALPPLSTRRRTRRTPALCARGHRLHASPLLGADWGGTVLRGHGIAGARTPAAREARAGGCHGDPDLPLLHDGPELRGSTCATRYRPAPSDGPGDGRRLGYRGRSDRRGGAIRNTGRRATRRGLWAELRGSR